MRRSLVTVFAVGVTWVVVGFAPPQGVNPPAPNPLQRLKNWGLTNSQEQSHISALKAWKFEENSPSKGPNVVVAVIDTGIDPTHQDLKKNIWHDPASPSRLDGSAKPHSYIYGWNFITNAPNPIDDHSHGTHVSGIIGATTNPQAGVSGVARHVSIMAVKYYSDGNTGAVNLRNTVKAIRYAVDHGAKIINYSGGGPEFSEEEYLAIKYAEAHGVLFVAAAGNDQRNTDLVENYYYPASYRLSNIISVAATDIHNRLLASSNWGQKRVDVAAPGENIYSTLPGGRYGYMSGTSQATAFVSGLAALLLSRNPSLKPEEVRSIIMSSVDRYPHLSGKVAAGGRINAYSALLAMKGKEPSGKIGIIAQKPVSLLNIFASSHSLGDSPGSFRGGLSSNE